MKKIFRLFAIVAAVSAAAMCALQAVTYNPSTYANPPGIYKNVAAGTATTNVKSGAGVLYLITFNTKGASANTLTCYDNTAASGTKIATIDTVNVNTQTLHYNVAFGTGLTCISATGTGADYTVSYR